MQEAQGPLSTPPSTHTHRLSRSSCVSPGVPKDRRLCSKEATAREGRGQGHRGSTSGRHSGAPPTLPLPSDVGAEADE